MNLFIKILWAVGVAAVAMLGYFLLQETKRANYLENYIRTAPARNARWTGKEEQEPEKETEPLNQNSDDQKNI